MRTHEKSPHVHRLLGSSLHNMRKRPHVAALMHCNRKHHFDGGTATHGRGPFADGGQVDFDGTKPINSLRCGGKARYRRHHAMGGVGKVRKGMMTASGRIIE